MYNYEAPYATNKVELIGTSASGNLPTIFSTSAQAGSSGDAGDLTITTQDLFIRDWRPDKCFNIWHR
ncbi:MAG: hypothetical protein KME29_17935 [Calothrix sp. FI2-JRJ7]|jgi:hypothetical protein|nr:hypothetical protein [Calothrix sp. FI2-JRJ7]